VTAKAVLTNGVAASDTVTFSVNDLGDSSPPDQCAPSIQIESPTDNTTFSQGESIEFQASVEDDHLETDELLYGVNWFVGGGSARLLGSGLQLNQTLDPGSYTIEARYGAAVDRIEISVVALEEGEEPNTEPMVDITSPQDKSQFQENGNVPVTFTGTASDAEDGPLTGSSLQWSYRQGTSGSWQDAGQGTSTTITFPGSCNWVSYQIQLAAMDSEGRDAHARIIVSVRGPTC
jgi:hypothetical protein